MQLLVVSAFLWHNTLSPRMKWMHTTHKAHVAGFFSQQHAAHVEAIRYNLHLE